MLMFCVECHADHQACCAGSQAIPDGPSFEGHGAADQSFGYRSG